jgi:hypothetical protein
MKALENTDFCKLLLSNTGKNTVFTKILRKILTKAYFCAKIGIVKVIFIIFEKNFHKLQKLMKIITKNENNFQKHRKEAKI